MVVSKNQDYMWVIYVLGVFMLIIIGLMVYFAIQRAS